MCCGYRASKDLYLIWPESPEVFQAGGRWRMRSATPLRGDGRDDVDFAGNRAHAVEARAHQRVGVPIDLAKPLDRRVDADVEVGPEQLAHQPIRGPEFL